MRITIEDTDEVVSKCIVEQLDTNDLNADELLELFVKCGVGYGYNQSSIEKAIKEYEPK